MKRHRDVRQAKTEHLEAHIMDGYVEIETPVSPEESNYIYVRPLGASQYFVGAHFGNDFDAWWELFHNASMRSAIKRTSPILYWLTVPRLGD
jgi:hypothetical protein